jgi:hypothetical protein
MTVSGEECFAISVADVRAIPGSPGKVAFTICNRSSETLEFIKSALEVQRRLPRSRHALPSAGRGYSVVTAIEPGLTINARGEIPFVVNVDRRTGFGGVIPAEPPSAGEPEFFFAARLYYRRTNGELYETGVYRRLAYPDLAFSLIEAGHTHLNYAGVCTFSGAIAQRRERPISAHVR